MKLHIVTIILPTTATPYPFRASAAMFNLPVQSRDTDPPEFTLRFSVTVVPPTYFTCQVNGTYRYVDVFREVTAGLYNSSSNASPVTNVTLTVRTRQAGYYQCTVEVFRASTSNTTVATSIGVLVTG